MVTPKLLSKERLARIFDGRILASDKPEILAHIAAPEILAHIAALEADNAALLSAAMRLHDDVAQGSLPFEKRETLRFGLLAMLDSPHPGAALLEEHRKALVRARNEAREAIAKMMESETGGHLMFWATRIRILKEPEE